MAMESHWWLKRRCSPTSRYILFHSTLSSVIAIAAGWCRVHTDDVDWRQLNQLDRSLGSPVFWERSAPCINWASMSSLPSYFHQDNPQDFNRELLSYSPIDQVSRITHSPALLLLSLHFWYLQGPSLKSQQALLILWDIYWTNIAYLLSILIWRCLFLFALLCASFSESAVRLHPSHDQLSHWHCDFDVHVHTSI